MSGETFTVVWSGVTVVLFVGFLVALSIGVHRDWRWANEDNLY